LKGQDVAARPRDRWRGYRFPLALAGVFAAVLYGEIRTYGLPVPGDAVRPAAAPAEPETAKPVAPAFLARLPPELEAVPGGVAPAAAGEFRDAPAVVEPGPVATDVPMPSAAAMPAMPDVPPLPPAQVGTPAPRESILLAALTPGMLPAPDTATLPAPGRPTPGLPLWRANAVPFEHRPGQKLVAVIIDDAGLDRARTARALRLPGPLTISFLPYAGELPRQAAEARRRGHELMLHAPMEPLSPFEHAGPDALTTQLPRNELLRRLEVNLARFDGYVGVNNHMGSRMTQSREAMEPLLQALRDRGLLFVDSRTIGNTIAGPLADRLGMPGAARDVFIDHDGSIEAVRARLADIERIAERTGKAVAIGHPHDVTLESLEQWLPTLAARGFTLAPISAIALMRQESGRLQAAR
jgi:polysaccharide deacetylase 2 family uncharacterized protein YibQ